MTLTRDFAPGWSGGVGRIDLPAVRTLLEGLGGVADSFVCGSAGFVEGRPPCCCRPDSRPTRFAPSGSGPQGRSAVRSPGTRDQFAGLDAGGHVFEAPG